MDWIPVETRMPDNGDLVLVTIEDLMTNDFSVIDCTCDWLADEETGEILKEKTFVRYVSDGEKTIALDMDDDKEFKVIAWMPYPQPFNQFRVIVAGSRTFDNYNLLKKKLDKAFEIRKPTAIVCGEAKGADYLGKKYAQENHIPVHSYPADWENVGKSAGYLRNEKMAANAEALIAFWNGTSAGTKHMIKTAKDRGLQVRVVNV